MPVDPPIDRTTPREGAIPVGRGALWYRDVAQGLPIVVLHGGPDFDSNYLLPELDRLADGCRLIYYDQRGRGRSAANVRPEDVSIRSDVDDIECVRRHLGLERVALLGHSWGGLLALEYALSYPDRVSHLILLNTVGASHADMLLFQQDRRWRWPDELDRMAAIKATPEFQAGDPDAVAAYYRIHFGTTLRERHLEAMLPRLAEGATPESILTARAIEDRLLAGTVLAADYDLTPRLSALDVPTLVIHGTRDFIPIACATRVAGALPRARFVLLDDCGHFAYLERPEETRAAIDAFFKEAAPSDPK